MGFSANQYDDKARGRTQYVTVTYTAQSGDKTIVAASATLKYVVTSFVAAFTTDFLMKFKSASTDLTGQFPLPARTLIGSPYMPESFIRTLNLNEALAVNVFDTTGAGNVTGAITFGYREMDS